MIFNIKAFKINSQKRDDSLRLMETECERYILELLSLKVRLIEIPLRLLRDPRFCRRIYISAFRADRATTKKQYILDLAFLDVEIEHAEQTEDYVLRDLLRQVQECVSWGVESFSEFPEG